MFGNISNNMTMCHHNETNNSCQETEHSTPNKAIGPYIFRCTLSLMIVTLHSLKIITVARTRHLQTVSNFFKCGLSIGGILLGLSTLSHAVLDMTHTLEQASTCNIIMLCICTAAGVTMSNVLLMYVEVFLVTHYTIMNRQVFSRRFAVLLVVATWLLWVLLGLVLGVALPTQDTVISNDNICHLNNGQISKTYVLTLCVLVIAHVLALIILQIAIILRIRAHANKFNVKREFPSNICFMGPNLGSPSSTCISSSQLNNVTHFKFSAEAVQTLMDAKSLAEPMVESLFAEPIVESNALSEPNFKAKSLSVPIVKANSLSVPIVKANSLAIPNVKDKSLAVPIVKANSLAIPNVKDKSLAVPNVKANSLAEPNVKAKALAVPIVKANSLAIPNVKDKSLAVPNVKANSLAEPNVKAKALAIPNVKVKSLAVPNMKAKALTVPNVKAQSLVIPNVKAKSLTKENEEASSLAESNVKITQLTQDEGKVNPLPLNENNLDVNVARRQANIKIYKKWMCRVSKLVRQMTAILVSFLICYIPFLVITLLNISTKLKQEGVTNIISSSMIGINPILNFIVFVTVNEKFRAALIKVLQCKKQ
ncbi:unnamed protein product [Owenia fusiformis]|uniref:G-protein coupled receptors family 1 profile domain-containing protein n=1 Tax=Owenia fusiformis TaxID=6347 RepID=A0A8S4N3Q0_OWEFU|nr:unnamed protein product [Owenia fusiformis]